MRLYLGLRRRHRVPGWTTGAVLPVAVPIPIPVPVTFPFTITVTGPLATGRHIWSRRLGGIWRRWGTRIAGPSSPVDDLRWGRLLISRVCSAAMAARRLDVLVFWTFRGPRPTARWLHIFIVGKLRGPRAAAFRFSTP